MSETKDNISINKGYKISLEKEIDKMLKVYSKDDILKSLEIMKDRL